MRAWEARSRPLPAAMSPGDAVLYVVIAVVVLLFSVTLAVAGVATGGTRAIPAVVAAVVFTAIPVAMLHSKWRRLRELRERRTPEACVEWFCAALTDRRTDAATAGLADYPSAARTARAIGLWSSLNPSAEASWRHADGPAEFIDDDHALVPLTMSARQRTGGVWVPGVVRVRTYTDTHRTLRKLVIRRRGRWYLVNARPADAIDLALARRLAESRGR